MTLSTTSPGDEREAFEAWRRATTKMSPDDAVALEGFGDDAPYANKITRVMHIAWKAAWQARASSSTVQQVGAEWMPIETAPVGREMFVARAVNVVHPFAGTHPYTSDPWCVWQDEHGKFARWPHRFPPTHWLALPSSPKSEQGDQQ